MFILQVYDGTILIKTEKIEPGASALSILGIGSDVVIFDMNNPLCKNGNVLKVSHLFREFPTKTNHFFT